uniref:Beta-defensin n=1 Tax=Bos indicus x Bos taurus TaxID=30522 RepID=A0A4W2DJA5_BOBOX
SFLHGLFSSFGEHRLLSSCRLNFERPCHLRGEICLKQGTCEAFRGPCQAFTVCCKIKPS